MMQTSVETRDRQAAFAIFRLTMGVNMFLHGLTRIISGVGAFATAMTSGFDKSLLPSGLVWGFLVVLPFIEAVIGVLLILGLRTRWGLIAGGLLIAFLVFGSAMKSDWATVGTQMIYAISFFLLLSHASYDAYGIETWRKKK